MSSSATRPVARLKLGIGGRFWMPTENRADFYTFTPPDHTAHPKHDFKWEIPTDISKGSRWVHCRSERKAWS